MTHSESYKRCLSLITADQAWVLVLLLLHPDTVMTLVNILIVKPEPVVQTQDRPALSEEEIERKCKSIIDEFLHINDYKVLRKHVGKT